MSASTEIDLTDLESDDEELTQLLSPESAPAEPADVVDLTADSDDEKKEPDEPAQSRRSQRARAWCFTDFVLDNLALWQAAYEAGKVRYCVIGKETAPETGRLHLQGYAYFSAARSLNGLKAKFGRATHFEIARGTAQENRVYCSKGGDFTELGSMPEQGARTDLRELAEWIKADAPTLDEVMERAPTTYCQARNGIRDLVEMAQRKKSQQVRTDMKVYLFSGPTATGKTYKALELAREHCEMPFMMNASGLQWWCGYMGQKAIILDEYANNKRCHEMLKYFDGYPLRLEVKGSSAWAQWDRVYITTNLRATEIHSEAATHHRCAFWRRITEFRDFGYGPTNVRPSFPDQVAIGTHQYVDVAGWMAGVPREPRSDEFIYYQSPPRMVPRFGGPPPLERANCEVQLEVTDDDDLVRKLEFDT